VTDVPLPSCLADSRDGALLTIHATPRSNANEIGPIEGDSVRVRVTAPPADGAANAAIIRLVADAAGVPKSRVSVATGATSRQKRLLIRGLSAAELFRRLHRSG
jgi:uncharacterized protein (TIGR00251 family)